MGVAAKKYVLNKFDKSKITDEWIELIANIDDSKIKKVPITMNDSFVKTAVKEVIRNFNDVLG